MYNFSSTNIGDGEVEVLSLGTKFVPVTNIPAEEKKIDILKFSRKILLKFRFHGVEKSSEDLIRPKSCYIPKKVSSSVLKGVIEDLEVFANEVPDGMDKVQITDNLTVKQRAALNTFKRRKQKKT